MTKTTKTKKGILVGLTVLLIGAVIFVVSFAVLGWDIYALDTNVYTAKSYEREADAPTLTKIVLNVDSFKVEVKSGESFKLDYYESSDSTVTVKDEGGVLTVTEKNKYGCMHINGFNLGRFKYKYVLTLPELEILNDMEIKSSNMDVTFTDVLVGGLALSGSNGDISIKGCMIDELTVKSSNCSLDILQSWGHKFDVHASNLDVTVKESGYESGTITGSNLDVLVENSLCTQLNVDGSNADVEILNAAVDDLTVHGSNLDADITLKGVKSEYTIISNGKDLPPSQTGSVSGMIIRLSGSNCDVDLKFID